MRGGLREELVGTATRLHTLVRARVRTYSITTHVSAALLTRDFLFESHHSCPQRLEERVLLAQEHILLTNRFYHESADLPHIVRVQNELLLDRLMNGRDRAQRCSIDERFDNVCLGTERPLKLPPQREGPHHEAPQRDEPDQQVQL